MTDGEQQPPPPIALSYATALEVGSGGPYRVAFACPMCSGRLRVVGRLVGKAVVCCHCEAGVVVPAPLPSAVGPELAMRLARRRCPSCASPLGGVDENACPRCRLRFDAEELLKSGYSGRLVERMMVAAFVAIGLIVLFLFAVSIFG